jgi:oligopeptide/dipeptide ABC transporter ATP-binding protein
MALGMLKAVQIPDPQRRLDAYPHELSGGMAQRIVIAIALICSPQFVIADDATSGLDVTVQTQVLELLRALMEQRGSSMLFITRDIGIAAHFCDRVAVIYRGEIIELAERKDFFLRPRHPYTIMLMAAFSHNAAMRAAWTRPSASAALAKPGAGCGYAARCPCARPLCATTKPVETETAPGHFVSCHFPVDR